MQRGRIAGPGHDYRGVVHRAVFAEHFDDAGNGRFLLTDGHVKALYAGAFLIDDRVDADGRLAGFSVADDQFALAASDGRHRVDGLDAGLQRHFDGLASGHARGVRFDRPAFGGHDRSAAVQRISQRIDHASQHGVADRHREQPAGAVDFVAAVDFQIIAEDDHAHGIFFEVEGQSDDSAGKLDHLARHDAGQAVDAGDAVAHLDHPADLADVDARFELFNFLPNYGSDFVGFEFHGHSCPSFVDG